MLYQDTPDFILQKQREILMTKSPQKRLDMTLQMAEDSRQMALMIIKRENPALSQGEQNAIFFQRMYKDCFSEIELIKIANHLKKQ